jgi:hypothetical protein
LIESKGAFPRALMLGEALKHTSTELDGALWDALVNYITGYENGSRTVTFRGGTTI